MTDAIELIVNEYPLGNLYPINEGDLLGKFKGRVDRALQIKGMKKRIVQVKGYEWQTEVDQYDAPPLRQMCNNLEVDRVAKSMIDSFVKNVQNAQGYEFTNYLDMTSFPEIPADGIVPDHSAILLIGQAKHSPSTALGMVYSELYVPYIQIFADRSPIKSNRIFGVFPADGKPTFSILEGGFSNNLHFQMRHSLAPKLQRNIEQNTEEFSEEANTVQRVYHHFQNAYVSTPYDHSKNKFLDEGEAK